MVKNIRSIASLGWQRRPDPVQTSGQDTDILVSAVAQSDASIIWATDADGRISSIHAPGLASLGVAVDQMVGKHLASVFEDFQGDGAIAQQRPLPLKMSARAKIRNHVVRCVSDEAEGGQSVWLQISGLPQFKGDAFTGYLGLAADVTHWIAHHQARMLQEKYDEVTECYNAVHFGKRFEAAFKGLTNAERPCTLIILEIDRYQDTLERYGVGTMDLLVAELASRMKATLRHRGEIGRLAADQFRILMPDVDDRGDLAELAEHFVKLLSQPYRVNGRRILASVSIGLAIAPYDATTGADLVDAANLALRSARQSGGGSYCIFSPEMTEEATRLDRIEEELEGALDRGEFGLQYTPLVAAGNNEVWSLRADLFWNSPELGEVLPDIFWPMIEISGASSHFGAWMLGQACRDAVVWPASLKLALAPPPGLLRDPDFRKILSGTLRETAFEAARLEIEISEEWLSADTDTARQLGDGLSALGVKLLASDFGAGSSAITLLADMGFARVVLSPSLVSEWAAQPERTNAILAATLSITRSFGVPASVRDVDAMDVLDAVIACGADFVEGPVFSAPLAQDQITAEDSPVLSTFKPKGFARQRAERITVLRKIGLIHEDHYYEALLKNISRTGAKIAGIAGVPVGTEVVLDLGNGQLAMAKVVNSDEKNQGLKFEVPLVADGNGGLMTRHRISPYTLAKAGLPIAALSGDHEALRAWKDAKKGTPSFVQLQLTHL